MHGLIEKLFIGLLSFSGSLASMANFSKFTTFVFLSNQTCMKDLVDGRKSYGRKCNSN